MTFKELFDTTNPDNNLGPFLVASLIAIVITALAVLNGIAHHHSL